MKFAFLGVGALSTPMIRNFADAGHDVIVWNRTIDKAEKLASDKIVVAPSPAEACKDVDVMMSCVSDDDALHAIFGDAAVFGSLGEGGTHVSMSTCSPAMSSKLAELAKPKGVTHLTCPVLGRPDFVERKAHRYLCSGDRAAFDRIAPVLDDVSD